MRVAVVYLKFSIATAEAHNVRVIRAAKTVCRRTTERYKVINPEYNIFRDQPIPRASPLRINTLLSHRSQNYNASETYPKNQKCVLFVAVSVLSA